MDDRRNFMKTLVAGAIGVGVTAMAPSLLNRTDVEATTEGIEISGGRVVLSGCFIEIPPGGQITFDKNSQVMITNCVIRRK